MSDADLNIDFGDCFTCGEGLPPNECPKSMRPCGHHCNCSWDQDICHWCGEEFGEEPELVAAVAADGAPT